MSRYILALLVVSFLAVFTGCNEKQQAMAVVTLEPEPTFVGSGSGDVKKVLQSMGADLPEKPFRYEDVEFRDLEGKVVKLSDYEGKVIMLNLWATWCPPCRAEMPSMDRLYEKYKKSNFIILAVSIGEDKKTVSSFLKQSPHQFPVFLDHKNEVSRTYSTGSIPTTYLINKKGELIARFVGGRQWDSAQAYEMVEILTNQKL